MIWVGNDPFECRTSLGSSVRGIRATMEEPAHQSGWRQIDAEEFFDSLVDYLRMGADFILLGDTPHPLTEKGTQVAIEKDGDLSWQKWSSNTRILRESLRRLRRAVEPHDNDEDQIQVAWSTGRVTMHPLEVQRLIDQGYDIITTNELGPYVPTLVEVALPMRFEGPEGSVAPLLMNEPNGKLTMYLGDPSRVQCVMASMTQQARADMTCKVYVMSDDEGTVSLVNQESAL